MSLRPRFVQGVGWSLASLLIASTLTGQGCLSAQRSVNVAPLDPPYRLLVSQAGKPGLERAIENGSRDEQIITQWLKAHETGWRPDLNTYAPGREIKGDRFDLNFVGRLCVMNYAANDKSDRRVQVSRTVEESDALPDLFGR